MAEIQFQMHPLPSVYLMELDIPAEFVEACNNYLDELVAQKDKVSAAHTLVGQIKRGEQLVMDHEDPRLAPFSRFLCEMGVTYINQFMSQSGQVLDGNRNVEMHELWSVHSYEGDYNPIHDHGTKTVMGISCTTWTRVPPQILQGPRPGSQEYDLYGASGESDGCLCFNYGQSSSWDRERLKPTSNVVVRPQVGRLYMFPSWMQHMVYPFQGDGERRTVAANINCFPVEGQQGNQDE